MKLLLISHIADCDGIMPVILTDFVFPDYDYQLLEAGEVDNYMKESLKQHTFDDYDQIIITDLSFSKEVADQINNSSLKDKLILFDHHEGALYLNTYPFAHVTITKDNIMQSGTTNYYDYLLTNYDNDLIRKKSVKDMVELVRINDTWDEDSPLFDASRNLGSILCNYGNDKFIDKYKNFLRESDTFYFNDTEETLLEIDNRRRQEYIDNLKDKVIFKEIAGNRVGIVFAEQYRSDVGHALASYYKDQVDLIMIINLNRSLSFRSLEDKADVNTFASLFGGHGHIRASGAPIPDGLKDNIVDYVIDSINKE